MAFPLKISFINLWLFTELCLIGNTEPLDTSFLREGGGIEGSQIKKNTLYEHQFICHCLIPFDSLEYSTN